MRGRRAFLVPADVQPRTGKVDLVPTQVDQLRRPQPMAVGNQDDGGVSVPPAVPLGRLDKRVDLSRRQVLTGAQSLFGRRSGVAGATVRFSVTGDTNESTGFAMEFNPS
jgi:hypothetical protein